MTRWWEYDQLPSGEPYDWGGASRGMHDDDQLDFHLDLGCGRVKKGRLGIDRFSDPGVDLVMDLDHLHLAGYGERAWDLAKKLDEAQGEIDPEDDDWGNPARGLVPVNGRMPFPTGTIESIITHHCFEHIGDGFIRLMDECHRILVPGGKLRVIVPLFPSTAAVADPDHKRYFMLDSFLPFMGAPDGSSWMESFSTPYSTARFEEGERDYTARSQDSNDWWGEGEADHREMRITLRKHG